LNGDEVTSAQEVEELLNLAFGDRQDIKSADDSTPYELEQIFGGSAHGKNNNNYITRFD